MGDYSPFGAVGLVGAGGLVGLVGVIGSEKKKRHAVKTAAIIQEEHDWIV